MKANFDKAKELIDKSQHIVLTTHERTDGDDLGTVLALAHHLQSQNKTIQIVITGGVPESLKFLPMSDKVQESLDSAQPVDLLIISGCSTTERVNHPELASLTAHVINIDHHPDNQNHGDVNIVDHTKSSVAELTYDLFIHYNWEMSYEVAKCLLTGIITDTGIFKHSNTTPSTLSAVGELVSKGARVATVAKHTHTNKNLQTLRAWGRAIENLHFDPESKMICSAITKQDLEELGNPPMSVFEGVAETLNKVPEANYSMLLKQDGNIIKGSLRSEEYKNTNVQEIAHKLGGGGHKLASGFSVEGRIERDPNGKWQII